MWQQQTVAQRITTESKQRYVKLFVQDITNKEKFNTAAFHNQLQNFFEAKQNSTQP